MGLLDAVTGALGGAGGGGGQADLMGVVGKLLQDSGGLQGLVQKFQQGGLGDVVQSWVSTGQNLPISADQLGQVLGPDVMSKLGGGAGGGDLMGQLSQMLPQVVDKLTPNGQLPAGGGTDIAGMLGQLMGGGGQGGGAGDLAGMLGGLLGKK
jgi:uncharacterized protein YidB (DUF937 family)